MTPNSGGSNFFCSFIYTFDEAQAMNLTWKNLMEIVENINGPWMIVDDYNCVMHVEERNGTVVRPQETRALRICTTNCGMHDLTSTGCMYT